MQIQVTDICADKGGAGVTDLGVHVCAVHIYKSAVVVDELTHLTDGGLEDAMCGWIGDHTAGKSVAVFFGFLTPLSEVRIAVLVALNHHGFKASLYARCRVRSMRRCRDK